MILKYLTIYILKKNIAFTLKYNLKYSPVIFTRNLVK